MHYGLYIGNNECVWHCDAGLMKTNIATKETVPFIPSCNSVLYSTMYYKTNINKLLCTKMSLTPQENNPCKLFYKTDLIWVDVNTADETIINLDNL